MASSKIGGAFFELSVNNAGFAAGMATAKATAAKGSAEIGESIDKNVTASTLKADNSIRQVASSWLSMATFIGSISIGIATAIDKMVNKTRDARDATDNLTAGIRRVRDELVSLAQSESMTSTQKAFKAAADKLQAAIEASSREASKDITSLSSTVGRAWLQGPLAPFAEYITNPDKVVADQMAAANNAGKLLARVRKELNEKEAKEKADAEIAELFRVEQARMELNRKLAEQMRKDAEDEFQEFIKRDLDRQENDRRAAKERIDEENRLSRLRMANMMREEDYRRSITQGFGVGDVATSDTTALRQAIETLAASQNYGNRD